MFPICSSKVTTVTSTWRYVGCITYFHFSLAVGQHQHRVESYKRRSQVEFKSTLYIVNAIFRKHPQQKLRTTEQRLTYKEHTHIHTCVERERDPCYVYLLITVWFCLWVEYTHHFLITKGSSQATRMLTTYRNNKKCFKIYCNPPPK